jgi:RNA polymerase-binding transcription factor DksA
VSTILSVAAETEHEAREEISEEEAERAAARQAGLVAARRLSAARGIGEHPTPALSPELVVSGELAKPAAPGLIGDPAAPADTEEPVEAGATVELAAPGLIGEPAARADIGDPAAPAVQARPHEAAEPESDGRTESARSVTAIERELHEVGAALDRIDDSLALLDAEDYGTCTVCQAEIPAAELAADPYLRTCSAHRSASGPG